MFMTCTDVMELLLLSFLVQQYVLVSKKATMILSQQKWIHCQHRGLQGEPRIAPAVVAAAAMVQVQGVMLLYLPGRWRRRRQRT